MNQETPEAPSLRDLLQKELQRRCSKNPQYSLRAFAASLEMSHSSLSLVISGKRNLSKKACLRVGEQLGYSPQQLSQFLSRRKSESVPSPVTYSQQILDLDSFSTISEWYHFAILSLLELPKAKFESKWIGRRLGIRAVDAKLAMERLKRLGLIVEKNGKWRQSSKSIKVDNKRSNAATRKFQSQLLLKSLESLENHPLERRDHTATTFVLDPALIPLARERIHQFRRELTSELEKLGNPKEVYNLSVQLYPLSKEKTK